MESRGRTVCLPVLIHGTEDRCHLEWGILSLHDMTTAASKSQFGGPSTSKNFVLHATRGITQWHSIQTGCRRSQHSAKVPTRSSRLSRLATAFQSDCLGRLVSCDPPEGITSLTLADICITMDKQRTPLRHDHHYHSLRLSPTIPIHFTADIYRWAPWGEGGQMNYSKENYNRQLNEISWSYVFDSTALGTIDVLTVVCTPSRYAGELVSVVRYGNKSPEASSE